MDEVMEKLGKLGLIPVIKLDRAEDALPLGRALLDGGLPCAEITFRTAAAEESIQQIALELPEIITGAGTVLSVEQAEKAVRAGARYIVSPGFHPAIVDWCLTNEVPVMPGVATPTDVMMALNKGLRILKLFPAEEVGGVKMLKALSGPFVDVRFIPTGGINAANVVEYLRLPNVHACGGSWMVPSQLINQKQFDRVTALVAEARAIVTQARGG
jgi:2-dehydro-3-deoxyphosphogluconate aldolase / (4S)-4-hydroxy-2-oxoglutarate aldolase